MTTSAFIPAFLNLGTGEIILICFVIVLLFGGRKIPELMRGIGKGVRNFRQGMNEITDEINQPIEESGAGKPAPAPTAKKDESKKD